MLIRRTNKLRDEHLWVIVAAARHTSGDFFGRPLGVLIWSSCSFRSQVVRQEDSISIRGGVCLRVCS